TGTPFPARESRRRPTPATAKAGRSPARRIARKLRRIGPLLEEPATGQHQCQIVAASRVRREDEERLPRRRRPASENEWTNQVDRRLERQHLGDRLQPRRHLGDREIDARKERHRRDDEREVVGEEVVTLGYGVEDEANR